MILLLSVFVVKLDWMDAQVFRDVHKGCYYCILKGSLRFRIVCFWCRAELVY